jgi:hypothetical protein
VSDLGSATQRRVQLFPTVKRRNITLLGPLDKAYIDGNLTLKLCVWIYTAYCIHVCMNSSLFEEQYGQNYRSTFQFATVCLVDQFETAAALFVQLLSVLSGCDPTPHFPPPPTFFFLIRKSVRRRYNSHCPSAREITLNLLKIIFWISLNPAV